MFILGIETSCDETAASLIEVKQNSMRVMSNIVSSQVKIHKKYGGIVPEVAARNHVLNIVPVIEQALGKIKAQKLDLIAVTNGPGLITSLIVGVEAAKTLSYLYKIPLLPINHLEGHIYINAINKVSNNKYTISNLKYPLIALIVSGGHTQLILMKKLFHYQLIGQTLDDAAGEAFDKVAKIFGLEYPGGPIISKLAQKGNPKALELPRPMIHSGDFNFSFSGLKTAVLYLQKKENKNFNIKNADVYASFEQAVVDVLVAKTIKAMKKYKAKTVLIGGGVAANQRLRNTLHKIISEKFIGTNFMLPNPKFTTDNALMIAIAGYFKYLKYREGKKYSFSSKPRRIGTEDKLGTKYVGWKNIRVDPNLKLKSWKK